MLTSRHRQVYNSFLQALQTLQTNLEQPEIPRASLQENFARVQQVFEQDVLALTAAELDAQTAPRWQSLQTEIYRAMRLLQTDRIRWQVARQAETARTRREEARDRVEQLIRYCQAILEV
jgi:hypothetical protein